jgi:hypothetical protein
MGGLLLLLLPLARKVFLGVIAFIVCWLCYLDV